MTRPISTRGRRAPRSGTAVGPGMSRRRRDGWRARLAAQHGTGTRAVLWLVGGLLLALLAVVAIAPELVGSPRLVGGLALLAALAGLPGLVIVLVLAVRRRGGPHTATGGTGDTRPGAADAHGAAATGDPRGVRPTDDPNRRSS